MKTLSTCLLALSALTTYAQGGEMLAGMSAMRAQKHSEAEEAFSRAVAIAPMDMKAWYYRAVNRIGMNDFGGALKDLDQALTLSPDDAHALLRRAEVKQELGAEHSALADLARILSVRPTGPAAEHALLQLGSYAMSRMDYAGAKAHYDQLVLIAPYNGMGWCNRGIALSAMHEDDLALADLDRAVEIDPTLDQAHLQRAIVLLRMNRKQEACAALHEAHDLGNREVEEMLLIYCE